VTRYQTSNETLTAGAALSGDPFWTSVGLTGATLVAATAAAINGAMGVRAGSTATNQFAHGVHNMPGGVTALSFAWTFVQPTANPTSTQQRVFAINDSAGLSVYRVEQHTDGTMLIRGSTGVTIPGASPSTGAKTAGVKRLLQGYIDSTGRCSTKITNLATSTVDYDSGLTTGKLVIGSGVYSVIDVGWSIGTKAGVVDLDWDDVAYQTTPTAGEMIAPYIAAASAGADQVDVEPFTTVTLTGTGTGSWSQTAGSPTVTLGGSGAVRTFAAPATMAGTTLTFDFGGDTMTVGVLPHNEWEKNVDTTLHPFQFMP